VLTLEVTVSRFSSYLGFLEGYAEALARLDRERGGRGPGSARRSGAWRARCGWTPAGPWRVGFDGDLPGVRGARDLSRLADDVFALPETIAAARKAGSWLRSTSSRDCRFDGGSVEEALRASCSTSGRSATCSPGRSRR